MSVESEAVVAAAKQIMIAIRTAPKSKGKDTLNSKLIHTKNDISTFASTMEGVGKKLKNPTILRDSKNVKDSSAVILLGISNKPVGLNCYGCGRSCKEMENIQKKDGDYSGPICIFKILDLGIALGSAAKVASNHCVDNRIMYSIGVAAKNAKIMNEDIVVGIPLSCSGKNIFFDRK